jgi:hypothetical protein
MPIAPLLAPAAQDLVDLATVKQYLEIAPGNTTDDDLLQALITGASNYWLLRTSRDSLNAVQDYAETYDGPGGLRLPLRNYPIVSVASVSVAGAAFAGSDGTTAGWVIDQSRKGLAIVGATTGTYPYSGLWPGYSCYSSYERVATQDVDDFIRNLVTIKGDTYVLSYSGGGGFPLGVQNIQVSYTAGYNGTPQDIAVAVTKQVAIQYKRRGWVDQKSIILPQGGGTANYRDWELPPDIEHVIQLYTRTGDRLL